MEIKIRNHFPHIRWVKIRKLISYKPGAHTYNPSYSGWHSLKAARANSSQDPISKKSIPKRAGGVAHSVEPEFKPQYHQRKKKKKKESLWTGTGV
jgi:hypothetical protein